MNAGDLNPDSHFPGSTLTHWVTFSAQQLFFYFLAIMSSHTVTLSRHDTFFCEWTFYTKFSLGYHIPLFSSLGITLGLKGNFVMWRPELGAKPKSSWTPNKELSPVAVTSTNTYLANVVWASLELKRASTSQLLGLKAPYTIPNSWLLQHWEGRGSRLIYEWVQGEPSLHNDF